MIRNIVAEILRNHVTLELEGIDRMYLNGYVPSLQTGAGFAYFLRNQLECRVPSTYMIAPMSKQFVATIEKFVATEGIELVSFVRGQRKDDVARDRLAKFQQPEGVLFVGRAQEKASVFRTEKRVDPAGIKYPWLVRSTAMVNHYYFYILDEDFGPLFIKFCSYFPYAAKLCINGHEWLKRQLAKREIRFEALDNGILSCDERIGLFSCVFVSTSDRKWLCLLDVSPSSRHDKHHSCPVPGGFQAAWRPTGRRTAAHPVPRAYPILGIEVDTNGAGLPTMRRRT